MWYYLSIIYINKLQQLPAHWQNSVSGTLLLERLQHPLQPLLQLHTMIYLLGMVTSLLIGNSQHLSNLTVGWRLFSLIISSNIH